MNRKSALRCLVAVAAVLLVAIVPGTASAVPPSNDNFANAETLTGRVGYVDGYNTDATKEAGEPNHAGNPGGASIWYVWTAPYAGRMTLSLCYSEFDTLLAVYTGTQLVNLQEVASNDNVCGSQSRLTFTTVAGETYRIAVDGANGATGYFELDWGLGPQNDDFAQAVGLTGDQGSVEGDNYAATHESGEPEHGPNGGASVWYRWTAPSSGPATFDLCSSNFDTLLAVYTGSTVEGLSQVAQDDNDCPGYGGSRVSFLATAGDMYSIAVDGSYEQGDFTLQWSRSALAPRNHILPSVLGNLVDGATLTADVGEWGGTPPLTFGYQWARCSVSGLPCLMIPGATGATYTLTSPDAASRMRLYVTATNSGGSSTAGSDLTEIVSPVAPINITPPSISAVPYLGDDLEADEGQWGGTSPFSFAYQWQTCDASGACLNIEGETTSIHTVTAGDLKKRLRVVVTASNGAGSATAASPLSRQASRKRFCVVPRVSGKALKGAKAAIRRSNCSVGRVRYARSARAKGRVISQSPRSGVRKAVGTKVNLVVSKGAR